MNSRPETLKSSICLVLALRREKGVLLCRLEFEEAFLSFQEENSLFRKSDQKLFGD